MHGITSRSAQPSIPEYTYRNTFNRLCPYQAIQMQLIAPHQARRHATRKKLRALIDSRFQAVDNTFNIVGQPLYWNKFEIKTAVYLFGHKESEYAMPLEALPQANPTGRISDSTRFMGQHAAMG